MVGCSITNGSRATASAGGTCKSNKRSTAIPQAILHPAATGPTPSKFQKSNPPAAVRKQAAGRNIGRLAHGQTAVWPNISNPMTTSGGKSTKRRPVSLTTSTAIATNSINAISHQEVAGFCSSVSSTTSTEVSGSSQFCATLSLCHRIESAAKSTVPSRTPGGYHQLLTPSTSGKRPAEIAGAIGDLSSISRATALPTVSRTERKPYGSARVKTIPIIAVRKGVIVSIAGELAQVPRGRVKTSCDSAPSSGNRT